MNTAALITVFGWAFFSFWSAIPAGMALSLSPESVIVTATLSYGCGVGLVVGVGAPLRARLSRHKPDTAAPSAEPSRMVRWLYQAWQRFGLFGLALLCPLTVGAQLGAAVGLSLGARPLRLVVLMTLGAGMWAVLIVLAIRFGIMSVGSL